MRHVDLTPQAGGERTGYLLVRALSACLADSSDEALSAKSEAPLAAKAGELAHAPNELVPLARVLERFLVDQRQARDRHRKCFREQAAARRRRLDAGMMHEHACRSTTWRARLQHESVDTLRGER